MWFIPIFGLFMSIFFGAELLGKLGPLTLGETLLAIVGFILGLAFLVGGIGNVEQEDPDRYVGIPYQEPEAPEIDWQATVCSRIEEYWSGRVSKPEYAANTLILFGQHNRPEEARIFVENIGLSATNEAIRFTLSRRRKHQLWQIESIEDLKDWLAYRRGEIL